MSLNRLGRGIAIAGLLLVLAGCDKTTNDVVGPTPLPGNSATGTGTGTGTGTVNGRLAISTTASRGWGRIDVTVNGTPLGTIRKFFEPGGQASCDQQADARLVATLPAGMHTYTATSDNGATWNSTVAVTAGGCTERVLTCPDGNCGPAATPRVTQALGDWGTVQTSLSNGGRPVLEVCVRDHECEDGDVVALLINGVSVLQRELFNTAYCTRQTFNTGTNTIGLYAVNGSGNKGACSYANANTGEVELYTLDAQGRRVTRLTQRWGLEQAAGTTSNIAVHLR